ncbi:MAG: phage holin family protein [Cyanobacteria bacterium J06623_5]
MLGFLLTTLVTAFSLLVVDFLVPGVGIATFPVALGAALSIGLVNSSIKPVIKLLSLPMSILTLGGFSLVVNGFCFWLASLVVPGFTIHGFFAFLFGPMALSFVSTALTNYLVRKGIDKKLAAIGRQQTLEQTELYDVRPAAERVITVEAVTIS